MKKKYLIALLFGLLFCNAWAATSAGSDSQDEDIFISKTYQLQYVSSELVVKKLRQYIIDHSPVHVMNVITVKIMKKDEEEFNFQMRLLDVPKNKKMGGLIGNILSIPRKLLDVIDNEPEFEAAADHIIQFRIYTVLASREQKPSNIDNEDLKRMLGELDNVLNFKSYQLDGISLMQVKNYSERNFLKLNSRSTSLTMYLDNVSITYEKAGQQVIEIGRLEVHNDTGAFISTKTSVNKNGYLVVGITPLGDGGDSLAIILFAEIN
jgi:hypothetical protein